MADVDIYRRSWCESLIQILSQIVLICFSLLSETDYHHLSHLRCQNSTGVIDDSWTESHVTFLRELIELVTAKWSILRVTSLCRA